MIYKMFKNFSWLNTFRVQKSSVVNVVHLVVDDIGMTHLFSVHTGAYAVVFYVAASFFLVFRSPSERSSLFLSKHCIRTQSEIEVVHRRRSLENI